MKTLMLGITICTALLLGACGGSSSGDNNIAGTTESITDNNIEGNTESNTDNNIEGDTESNTEGNTEGSTEGSTEGNTESIAGLWDVTEVDPDFGEDIYYLRISSDGTITTYDYQQDEFDGGDNCYIIEFDQTLTPIGGNQYTSEFDDLPSLTNTLTITRSGNVLTVSYTDIFDENDNGDVTEILTFNYPMLTGVDPVFNECQ